MTKNEAIELVALINAHYPGQAKLSDANIDAYVANLVTFPIDLAKRSLPSVVQQSEFFPSVAKLVTAIVDLHIDLPTPESAWNDLLRRNTDDDWQNLDPTIRTALRAAGGTHALSHDEAHFVRRAFLESYTALRKERADSARDVDLPKLERARLTALPAKAMG